MPAPDFLIKTGDTASSIFATLENSGGTRVDIQGATVNFKMKPISGGTLYVAGTAVNAQVGAGTVLPSTKGDVTYAWASAPGTVGLYIAEWEVTYASGLVQTFPNAGYMSILVTRDL